MIYLSYMKHLNLVEGNSCITSISFTQLATNGGMVPILYHKKIPTLKVLCMCLSFGRILSLHKCLSTPLGSNHSQAPAFPGDATKVHVPGHEFLQGLADSPSLVARVSGVSFPQEAMWNLKYHQQPWLKSMAIYTQRGRLKNEGYLVEKGIYHDGWRAFLAREAAAFPATRWPQGPGQTLHLDHAPVWWLRVTELGVWPLCEY